MAFAFKQENTQIIAEDETMKKDSEDLVSGDPICRDIAVTRRNKEYQYHLVKPGDTLWELSRQYYGCGRHYLLLAECNGIENADLIYTGQLLTVPIDVTETLIQKNDWFYQNAIPIQSPGEFSFPMIMENNQSGNIEKIEKFPAVAEIRTIDLDFKRKGYKMVEAVFEMNVEHIPFSENTLYYWFEVADRYTGVSFIQRSTCMKEMETDGGKVKVYELAIRNPESGYEGTVDIVYSSKNNRITIQAEVPKEYDGLVFGFGEYPAEDRNEYDRDKLYKVNQFPIEHTEKYYFTEDGY